MRADAQAIAAQADVDVALGQPLHGYDLIVVPGGYGTRPLQQDETFLAWLRTAKDVPLKTSVCTGSLLLGAAGFLRGKRATTHPSNFDGSVVTARGVTSAIDLGLHLVKRLAGEAARRRIADQMDYPYRF